MQLPSETMSNQNRTKVVKKTELNIKHFREWMATHPRNENRDLVNISPDKMDKYVGGFLLTAQNTN